MKSITTCYKNLYIFHYKTHINVKQVMKNHIRVKKVSVTKHDHHRFQWWNLHNITNLLPKHKK